MARKELSQPQKSYLKNLKKSALSSSVNMLKGISPSIIGTTEDVFKSGKELALFARDKHNQIKQQGNFLRNTSTGKMITDSWKQMKKDIKSGNFTGELEEEISGGYDDFDIEDWNSSYDDNSEEALNSYEDISTTDKLTANVGMAITKGNIANLKAMQGMTSTISASQIASSKANAQEINQAILYQTNVLHADLIKTNSILGNIDKNLTKMIAFQNENVSITNQAIMDYIKGSSEALALITDRVVMANDKNKFREEKEYQKRSKDNDFLSNTGLDIKSYFKRAKKNFSDTEIGSVISLVTSLAPMLGDSNSEGDTIIRPLKTLINMGAKALVPKNIKRAAGRLDKTFSKGLENMLYRLGDYSWDFEANPLMQVFAQTFGMERKDKNYVDMARYNKDTVMWNGIAQKALVDVIPSYLSKIEVAISKMAKYNEEDKLKERRMDYEKGQFRTIGELQKSYIEDLRYASSGGFETRDLHNSIINIMNKHKISTNYQEQVMIALDNYMREMAFGSSGLSVSSKNNMKKELGNILGTVIDGDSLRDKIQDIEYAILEMTKGRSKFYEEIEENIHGHDIRKVLNENYGTKSSESFFSDDWTDSNRYSTIDGLYIGGSNPNKKDIYDILKDEYGYQIPREYGISKNVLIAYDDTTRLYIRQEDLKEKIITLKKIIALENKKFKIKQMFHLNSKDEDTKNFLDNFGNKAHDIMYGKSYMDGVIFDPSSKEGDMTGKQISTIKESLKTNNGNSSNISDIVASINQISPTQNTLSNEAESALISFPDHIIKGSKQLKNLIETQKNQLSIQQQILSELRKLKQAQMKSVKVSEGHWKKLEKAKKIVFMGKDSEDMRQSDTEEMLDSAGDAADEAEAALEGDDTNVFIKAVKSMEATAINATAAIKAFGVKLFGKDGLEKKEEKRESVDQAKNIKDRLFNEKDGYLKIIPQTWGDAKKKVAYWWNGKAYSNSKGEEFGDLEDGESVKSNMSNVKDWLIDNIKKNRYGKDYETSEKYQKDKQKWDTIKSAIFGKKKNSEESIVEEASSEIGNAVSDAANSIREGANNLVETVFGDPEKRKKNKEQISRSISDNLNSDWKKKTGKIASGAVIGAGLGTLASMSGLGLLGGMLFNGGPIAGAIVGGGLTLLTGMEGFKKFLLGEKDDDGKRMGGVITKSMQERFKKFLPAMVSGAVLGGVKGLFTGGQVIGGPLAATKGGILLNTLLPGGVLGGAILGLGIGILKNSDRFKNALFGKNQDKDNNTEEDTKGLGKLWSKTANLFGGKDRAKEFGKRGLKGAAIGAGAGLVLSKMGLMGMMLSPGGPIGMGILGLGLGFASASEKVNTVLFGDMEFDKNGNPTGKRAGGMITKIGGMLQTRFIQPIADKAAGTFEELGAYTRMKLFPAVQEAFYPITYGISTSFHNVGDAIKIKFENIADDLGDFLKKKVSKGIEATIGIVNKIGQGTFDIFKWAGKGTIDAVSLPFHLAAMAGNIFTGKDRKKYFTRALGTGWEDEVSSQQGFKNKAKGIWDLFARGNWREYITDDEETGRDAESIKHLFGFKDERKEAKNDFKMIRSKNKVISNSNKLSANIAKELQYNPNIVLTNNQIDKYRKKILKQKGLAEALGFTEDEIKNNLMTSQDIMDFTFRRSDWQNKIKNTRVEAEMFEEDKAQKEESAKRVIEIRDVVQDVGAQIHEDFNNLMDIVSGGAWSRHKGKRVKSNGEVADEIVKEASTADEINNVTETLHTIENERKNSEIEEVKLVKKEKEKNKREQKEAREQEEASALSGQENSLDNHVEGADAVSDEEDEPVKDQKKGILNNILSFFTGGSGGIFGNLGKALGVGLVGLLGKDVLWPLATKVIWPFLKDNIPKVLSWVGGEVVNIAKSSVDFLLRKSTGTGGRSYNTEAAAAATGKNYIQMEDGTYFVGESNEYVDENGNIKKAGYGIDKAIGKVGRASINEYVKYGTKGIAKTGSTLGRGLGSIAGATAGATAGSMFGGGIFGGIGGLAKAGVGGKIGSKIGNAVGTIAGKALTGADTFIGTTASTGIKNGVVVTASLAKNNLAAFMLGLVGKIENLFDNKLIKTIFKGTSKPEKAFKKIMEEFKSTLINAAKRADDKVAVKATELISQRLGKEGAEDAAGIATAGLVTIVFAAYDLATGFFEADKLFNVESNEVTLPMRIISKYFKCLMGLTTITAMFDVALEIFTMITGKDAKCAIATALHNALLTFIPGGKSMIEQLDFNQDKMQLETMVYNYINGDNLSTNNYSELKDPGWFKKVWNKVTGKDKKFSEYDQLTDELLNAGFTLKNGKIYSISGSEVDMKTALEYLNSAEWQTKKENKEFIDRSKFAYTNDSSSPFSNTNGILNRGVTSADINNSGMYGIGTKAIGFGLSQSDPRWGSFKLGKFPNGKTSTMATGGCGPTALASIAGTDPLSVAKMAKSGGMLVDGGASASLMTNGASKLGLQAKRSNSSYYGDLQKGKPVILSGIGQRGTTPFTKAGHVVTATGITKSGGIVINDPMTGRKSVYSKKAIDKGLTNAWSYSKKTSVGYGPAGYGMEDYRWNEEKQKYELYENGQFTGLTMSKEDYDFYMTGKDENGKEVRGANVFTYGKTYDQKEQTKDKTEVAKGSYSEALLAYNQKMYASKYRNGKGLWWYPFNDPDWADLSYNGTKLSSGGGSALDVVGLAALLSNLADKAITPAYLLNNILPRMKKNMNWGFDWDKLFDKQYGMQYLPELVGGYRLQDKRHNTELENYKWNPTTGTYVMYDEYGNPYHLSKDDYEYYTTKDNGFGIPPEVKNMKPEEILKTYGESGIATRFQLSKLSPSTDTNYDDIAKVAGMYLMRGRTYQNSPFSLMETKGLGKLPLMSGVKKNTPTGSLIGISTGNIDDEGNAIGAVIAPSAGSLDTAIMKSNFNFLRKKLGESEKMEPISSNIWRLTNKQGSIPLTNEQIMGLDRAYNDGTIAIDDINSTVTEAQKSNKKSFFEILSELLGKVVTIGMKKISNLFGGKDYTRIMDDKGNYLTYTDSEGNVRYEHDGSLAGEGAIASNSSESTNILNPSTAGYSNVNTTTSIGGVKVSPYIQAIANNASTAEEKAAAYTLAAQNASEGSYNTVVSNDRGAYSVGLKQWHIGRAKKMLEGFINSGNIKIPEDKEKFQYFANKSGGTLTQTEANELSTLLTKYQSTMEPYQYEYGVKDNLENEMKTPYAMYKSGELLNARSMIVPGAIANTGSGYLSGAKDSSQRYWNWRNTWKTSPYNKKNAATEIDDVASSLMDKESAWGTFGGYDNYITRAKNFAKSLPSSVGFGNAIGYGIGANEVINTALQEVGTKEYPADSNTVKYNTEYYNKEVSGSAYPWCVVFPWWVFKHTGAAKLFYDGNKTASSTQLMNWSKTKGRFIKSGTGDPAPGDVIFFNFKNGKNAGDAQHTGLVYQDMGNGNVRTIEGNTGSGNDANGGAVQIRDRNIDKSGILGYYRPEYDDAKNIPITSNIGANASTGISSDSGIDSALSTSSNSSPLGIIDKLKESLSKVNDIGNNYMTNLVNTQSSVTGYGYGDALANKLSVALEADGVENKLDILIEVAREIAANGRDKKVPDTKATGYGSGATNGSNNIIIANKENPNTISHSTLNTLKQMHNKIAKKKIKNYT